MSVTEEQILSQAGAIQAGRRHKIDKQCEQCGEPITGLASKRFCSDRCRMQASRGRERSRDVEPIPLEAPRDGETYRDFFVRTRAEAIARGELDGDPLTLTPELEAQVVLMSRLWERYQEAMRRQELLDDSTVFIREDRARRARRYDAG